MLSSMGEKQPETHFVRETLCKRARKGERLTHDLDKVLVLDGATSGP